MERSRPRLSLAIGLALLFALNLWLYAPLFDSQQKPYKGSIAAGYAGITRFVAEHPNPWGWNPQQYAGQPAQFTYPPIIPYKAALLHWLTGVETFHAYRIVVGLSACLGPVTLAFAFYFFTRSLSWSLLLGLAYSIGSPIYGIFEKVDADRGSYYLPWRLLVQLKYGEAPHVVGLTMLPLILVSLRWGMARRDLFSLFVMAASMALAPLTNWLSAFGLALCVLWMFDGFGRLLKAGLLAYLLAAFWITPEYVWTTLFNWPKDSYGYRVEQSHWPLYLGLVATVGVVSFVLRLFRADWLVRYATAVTAGFLYVVGGFYWFGVDTIPESRRYALELELFLMLTIFAWCWKGWNSKEGVDRFCVGIGMLALLIAGAGQLRASRARTAADWGIQDREQTVEYQLANWLNGAHPRGRVFATGGLRFRLNAWYPLSQVGGTFESGLRNRIAVDYYYQVRTSEASKPELEAVDTMRELAAIGAEYVVTHDLESEEYYKDIKNVKKFEVIGKDVYSPTPHDHIFQVPFQSLAANVKPEELPRNQWKEALPLFAGALLDFSRPRLSCEEINPSVWAIEGQIPPGFETSFLMNWDPGWTAKQDDRPIEVGKNNLGLIQLRPRPAEKTRIVLRYEGTSQQKVFGAISLLAWIGSITLCIRARSWRAGTSTPLS